MTIIMFLFIFCFCRYQEAPASSPPSSPSPTPSDLEVRPAKSPCQYESYKIFWNVFAHIFNHWNAMTIKFECSYDVDINMYILCCSNRICACPSGRPCLQVTPPIVAYILPECWLISVPANFRRLICPFLAKVMPDFFVNSGMTCARICTGLIFELWT